MNLDEIRDKIPEGVDLSLEEDLAIGVMNLISIEEHLFHTAAKTGETKYLALLDQVRAMRTEAMKDLVTDPQGEEWCISKHLLAASKRFEECTTKLLSSDPERAERYARVGADLFAYFFAIRLGVMTSSGPVEEEEKGLPAFIRSIVDCCKEW